jgi:hypothetical protein
LSKIYKGDIGVKIRVNTGIDLTGFTNTKILVWKPGSQRILYWPTTIETPATSGYMYYITTVTGLTPDLDTSGTWKIQAYGENGSNKYYGETAVFQVYDLGK